MNAPAACSLSISSRGRSTKQTLILQLAASHDKHHGELRSLVENLLALKTDILEIAAWMPSSHDNDKSRRQTMHREKAIFDTNVAALVSAASASYQFKTLNWQAT